MGRGKGKKGGEEKGCTRCLPLLPLQAAASRIFRAKMQAVADDDTDAAANATERYLVSPIAYLNNAYLKRFGMPGSLYAGRVAVVCW